MTSEWVIRWKSGLHGRRWGETDEVSVYSPQGLTPHNVRGVGPDVFFRAGGGVNSGVMVWQETTGARALIHYPGDVTRAASNFGTDGSDMVWTLGEGQVPTTSTPMPTRSIMTAPYSTDSDTVAQTERRLRSDPGPFMVGGFAVGCGYAARSVSDSNPVEPEKSTKDLLVIRLSDGVSWKIKMPPVSEGAGFSDALGISCDDVFAIAHFPDDSVTFVRIRLDSLGPGLAPD